MIALTTVVAAEPCADYVLLNAPAPDAPLPEACATNAPFVELIEELAAPDIGWTPAHEVPVLVYTHEQRWIDGTGTGARVSPRLPSNRLLSRSAGAPVFDHAGRVVGMVTYSDIRQPDASMCRLADRLPGWALRKAREAEDGRHERWPPTR
jgi:hypothetical protein